MKIGTHNSGTGGKLVWWLRPLAWLINPTSKCQNKSIAEQLADGVRLFNLQVAYYKGEWHFSHGLALYEETVLDALGAMSAVATPEEPIYFQLYLDKSLFLPQEVAKFRKLVECIYDKLCGNGLHMLTAWVEGTDEYIYSKACPATIEEHYWTMTWAKSWGDFPADYLPLPKRWARKNNDYYRRMLAEKEGYLMLDFYNI